VGVKTLAALGCGPGPLLHTRRARDERKSPPVQVAQCPAVRVKQTFVSEAQTSQFDPKRPFRVQCNQRRGVGSPCHRPGAIGVRRTTGRRVLALNLRTLVREFKGPALNEQRRQRLGGTVHSHRRGSMILCALGRFRCSGAAAFTRLSDDPPCYWRPPHRQTPLKHLVLDGRIIGPLG